MSKRLPGDSGVATGGSGEQIVLLGSEKCASNRGKEGKIGEKIGKRGQNREEKAKIGKVLSRVFFLPLLTDRAGYATVWERLIKRRYLKSYNNNLFSIIPKQIRTYNVVKHDRLEK